MTLAETPSSAEDHLQEEWPLATVAAMVLACAAFLQITHFALVQGLPRLDIAALQDGAAGRAGDWLTQSIVSLTGTIFGRATQGSMLWFVPPIAAGLWFGVLYRWLRRSEWTWPSAVLVLVLIAGQAGLLYSITASGTELSTYLAVIAMVAAVGGLEDVGDVQSLIWISIVLPLLFLAGPVTAPLIVPIGLYAALSDADARRDGRALLAMLVVAFLPTVLAVVSVAAYMFRSQVPLAALVQPYAAVFAQPRFDRLLAGFAPWATVAPLALLPIAYCVWARVERRRQWVSAALVLVVPVYLTLVLTIFRTGMSPAMPAVALIGAFASWLSVTRLPPTLRLMSLAALLISALLGWSDIAAASDPQWAATVVPALNAGVGSVFGTLLGMLGLLH